MQPIKGIKPDKTLNCEGYASPIPLVQTKEAIEQVGNGDVLEVVATDKDSVQDLQAWAKETRDEYIGYEENDDKVIHYIKKASPEERAEAKPYQHDVSNDALQEKLQQNHAITVLDVREEIEHMLGHIPGSVNIPLSELKERLPELDKGKSLYVICRTGNRSDIACKLLSRQGFKEVYNVLPGMSDWQGSIED